MDERLVSHQPGLLDGPAGTGAALAHRAEHLAHLEGFERPGLDFARRHDGPVVGQGVEVDRLAVHVDERHAGRLRGVGHRLGGRGVDRVHDDRVHAGGDEVVDLVELPGHVVLCVLYPVKIEGGRVLIAV